MANNQEKKASGHLYTEIARLKQQILEIDEQHRTELSTWTRKCGQLGNEIGNLRKQLAEQECHLPTVHQEPLSFWTKRCGDMGNEIGRLRKQLADKESSLTAEHQATLHSWSKTCGELVTEIGRLRKKLSSKEIEYQTERDQAKFEIEVLRQRFEKLEFEQQQQRTVFDLNELIEQGAELMGEILDTCAQQLESVQINDVEADRIVKTYYSSDGETDEVINVNESAVNEDLSGSITEDLLPIVTDQKIQPQETVKQKPKSVFWTTMKRHVSLKGKLAKSSTLTYKVSGTESEL